MGLGSDILRPIKEPLWGAHFLIEHSDYIIDGFRIILKQEGRKPEDVFHFWLGLELVKDRNNGRVDLVVFEVADDLGNGEREGLRGRSDRSGSRSLLLDFDHLVAWDQFLGVGKNELA